MVLRPKSRALLDAEAVLLVDDHETEVEKLHPVFYQRVGADKQVYRSRSDAFEYLAAFAAPRGTREHGHPHVETLDHAGDRGEVLAREELRGGHHAGLESVVDGQQHRHEGHQGLAAAHVALQEAVHLETRGRVAPYLAKHAFLRSRECERKFFVVKSRENISDLGEDEAVALRHALRAPGLDVELQAQELVELQAVLRLPERLGRLGKVDVIISLAQRHQSVTAPHILGHEVDDAVFGSSPGVADDTVHHLDAHGARQLVGRGINALQAAFALARKGLFDGFDLGVGHAQFASEKGRAAENKVFAPHLDAVLDPLDTPEPH